MTKKKKKKKKKKNTTSDMLADGSMRTPGHYRLLHDQEMSQKMVWGWDSIHGTKAYERIAWELIPLQRWFHCLLKRHMTWTYGLKGAMTKGVQDEAQWMKMSRLPAGPSSLWIR